MMKLQRICIPRIIFGEFQGYEMLVEPAHFTEAELSSNSSKSFFHPICFRRHWVNINTDYVTEVTSTMTKCKTDAKFMKNFQKRGLNRINEFD